MNFFRHKKEIYFILALVIAGQLLFALISPRLTAPRYEGRIYATTGVKHKQEDLHKLNEAAHYFGQTIIGWLKFPSFLPDLQEKINLPEGSKVSAYIQERQNIIFRVNSPIAVRKETLTDVKNFIQEKIDQYNAMSQTEFVLTNLDYELIEIRRSYLFGAMTALIAAFVIGLAGVFVIKEFS